jgi:hypothetical protein
LEQNQNTNEQLQPKEIIPLQEQQSAEPIPTETSPPVLTEIKEETPTPVLQPQAIRSLPSFHDAGLSLQPLLASAPTRQITKEPNVGGDANISVEEIFCSFHYGCHLLLHIG